MSRAEKVAEAIRQEVSEILQRQIRDPRIGFITITRVDMTDDLRYAKIYFSILGEKVDKQKALKGLRSATGYVRRLIGERIKLRYSPQIVFKLDESVEYSIHIAETLKKIKKSDVQGQKTKE